MKNLIMYGALFFRVLITTGAMYFVASTGGFAASLAFVLYIFGTFVVDTVLVLGSDLEEDE